VTTAPERLRPPEDERPPGAGDGDGHGGAAGATRTGPGLARAGRVLRVLAGVGAVGFLALYVLVALRRIDHPYELEWMEGGVVDHVRRVLDGRRLYDAPSLEFTPYLYTPLYVWVSAGASAVLGVGFFPLRLVSFVASLAAFAGIHRLVRVETGDRWAALVATGLFAACFRLGGAWFDLARVDTLFLALLVWGLVVARRTARTGAGRDVVLAGVLLSLAFLAKQSALLPALATAVALLVRPASRRVGAALGATLAAGIGGSWLVLHLATGGWFTRYVFVLPEQHELVHEDWVRFWTRDLLDPLWPVLLVIAAGVVVLARSTRGREQLWWYVPVLGGLVAAAWSSRLHSGGYDNVVLPAYLAVAVAVGLALHALREAPRRVVLVPLAGLLVVGQFVGLRYDVGDQLPPAGAVAAGDRLVDRLRALPGPVHLPGHGWLLARAGHETGAQSAAIGDVLRGDIDDGRLREELATAIREQRFAAVVVESARGLTYLPRGFSRSYRLAYRLTGGELLLPVTGTRTQPLEVWLPRGFGEG